jgi:CRP/FNR family cyclic AMP-dependent transcriptional regulator
VLEGRVREVKDVGGGRAALLHVGEAGCWFAYYSTFHRRPSIGSVVADSPVRTLLLLATKFERIMADEPRYFRAFADLALEHYATLFRYAAEAHGISPEARLCARLADLAEFARKDRAPTGPITLTVSQTDLATLIGVSRQTVNAFLARLEARGLVEHGFRRIRVVDELRLRSEGVAAEPSHRRPHAFRGATTFQAGRLIMR